jgi:hypothetical protein
MAELSTFKGSDLGDETRVDGEGTVACADVAHVNGALQSHQRALES